MQFFFLDLALSRLKGLSDCSKDKLKGLSIVQRQMRWNVRIHTRMRGYIIKIRDELHQIWVEASPEVFIEIEQSDFFARFVARRDFRVKFWLQSILQPYHLLRPKGKSKCKTISKKHIYSFVITKMNGIHITFQLYAWIMTVRIACLFKLKWDWSWKCRTLYENKC